MPDVGREFLNLHVLRAGGRVVRGEEVTAVVENHRHSVRNAHLELMGDGLLGPHLAAPVLEKRECLVELLFLEGVEDRGRDGALLAQNPARC